MQIRILPWTKTAALRGNVQLDGSPNELLGPKNNIRAKTGVEAGVIQIDAENGDQVLGEAVLRNADGVASTTLLSFPYIQNPSRPLFHLGCPLPTLVFPVERDMMLLSSTWNKT
ncbi:MAG TPA: hypothetical protein VN223_00055 [Candidatus Elarobacter sp.]|nr:hypothetical protein [Candidatus Elarobacter sp.]